MGGYVMERKKIIVLDAGVAPKQVADARGCCVLGPRPQRG